MILASSKQIPWGSMGCMFTLVRLLSNLRVASCKYIHLKSNIASKKMKKQSSMLNNLGSYVNGSM